MSKRTVATKKKPIIVDFVVDLMWERNLKRRSSFPDVDPFTTWKELGIELSEWVTANWIRPKTKYNYNVFGFSVYSDAKRENLIGFAVIEGTGSSDIANAELWRFQRNPLFVNVHGKLDDPSPFEHTLPSRLQRQPTTPTRISFTKKEDEFETPPEEDEEAEDRPGGDLVTPIRQTDPFTRPPKVDPRTREMSFFRDFESEREAEDDPLDDLFGEGKRQKLKCSICNEKIGVLRCKNHKKVTFCGLECYAKSIAHKK